MVCAAPQLSLGFEKWSDRRRSPDILVIINHDVKDIDEGGEDQGP